MVRFSPFLVHAFVMGLFSSIIGPFGGFFASGFKRAFKIKVTRRGSNMITWRDGKCGNMVTRRDGNVV